VSECAAAFRTQQDGFREVFRGPKWSFDLAMQTMITARAVPIDAENGLPTARSLAG
jgi:hypothetical protein